MTSLSLFLIVQLLLLGAASGFLAGLLGIGGGMVMVPFLTIMLSQVGVDPGLSVKMAIATSMAAIMFTSVSSVRAHHRRGAVRWDIVRKIAPGIVIGSLIGSMGIFAVVKGSFLALFFGVFVAFSATQMLLNKKPKASRQMPGVAGQLAAGGVIGLLSGLVGAGGGFLSVPFMAWCNVAIHSAVATSAALGFPIAVANVLGYVLAGLKLEGLPPGAFGYIWLPALALIVVVSVLTAPLGAKAAHRLPVTALKRIFALILYLLAVYMFWKGFQG
jgi:uncharacterized membrane protein YfcA